MRDAISDWCGVNGRIYGAGAPNPQPYAMVFDHGLAGFDRYHGDSATYQSMMASDQGWPYILGRFREACTEGTG